MPDTNSSQKEVEANEREPSRKNRFLTMLGIYIFLVDIFATFGIIRYYLSVKYHTFIFPKEFAVSLGERVYPIIVLSLVFLLSILYSATKTPNLLEYR